MQASYPGGRIEDITGITLPEAMEEADRAMRAGADEVRVYRDHDHGSRQKKDRKKALRRISVASKRRNR